eukprot:TRINITY_DN12758_c0_g1_i1.p1 TRINITY_DN12758_c0_g1~~TRINITY_DN12758_c0_g1_i1.p1  ORF type:complete len:440 (+),score=151.59 TRINITY_DN12758_c0_g1_i1:81-1400(+)
MGKMNGLTRSIYRKLFNACRRIDSDPALRTLLTGFCPQEEGTTEARMKIAALVTRCNGGAEWFVPHQQPGAVLEITPCLQDAFRDPSRDLSEAMAAIKFLGEVMRVKDTERLITDEMPPPLEGGEALASRQVTDLASVYIPSEEAEVEAAEDNPGSPEGQDASASAEADAEAQPQTEAPDEKPAVGGDRRQPDREKPMLLVAHPILEGEFQESVMLVSSHDDTGTTAFILNQPLRDFSNQPLLLRHLRQGNGEKQRQRADCVFSTIESTFSNERLYYGGPVYLNCLRFIHTHGHITGARPLGGGLYSDGTAREIVQLLESGEAKVEDFLPICGKACWAPKQLQWELEQGTWLMAEGTQDFHKVLGLNRAAFSSGDAETWERGGEAVWRETLRLMESEGDLVPQLARIQGAWRHAHTLAGRPQQEPPEEGQPPMHHPPSQ